MKRSFDIINCGEAAEDDQNSKVVLVEREPQPNGIPLVNAVAVAKKTHVENMELEDGLRISDTFIQANARNKLDVIGCQMKNLQELMTDVLMETKVNSELHSAACNFVKKPGHVYHLYERPSGQKYFSMLSPQEWVTAPHNYLGSWRLEADQSWTSTEHLNNRYEGLNLLREIFSNPSSAALVSSSR